MIRTRSSSVELRGGVALDRERQLVRRHADAVVGDRDQRRGRQRRARPRSGSPPASSAFSISSLSAAAGRSTTSPAAMRLTRFCGRRRIGAKARQAPAMCRDQRPAHTPGRHAGSRAALPHSGAPDARGQAAPSAGWRACAQTPFSTAAMAASPGFVPVAVEADDVLDFAQHSPAGRAYSELRTTPSPPTRATRSARPVALHHQR